MAAEFNTAIAEMDKTAFAWTTLCAICHPGGGPTEHDRAGHKYYDVVSGAWGYEALGMSEHPPFSGDYTEVTGDGTMAKPTGLRSAPWDKTGVAEADCLHCHRKDRARNPDTGAALNWVWRTATLRGKDKLKDSAAEPVAAFAAASTAGQGWFDKTSFALDPSVPAGKPPIATQLDIDYSVGVADGSLVADPATGHLRVASDRITAAPKDLACWSCHATPDAKKRGRSWFDPAKDVHYAALTQGLADPVQDATACTVCHPLTGDPDDTDREHDIAKGHATLGSVRNDTDFVGLPGTSANALKVCTDCHVDASSSPPLPESFNHTPAHLAAMSCEFCHIPYKLDSAELVVDNATTGGTKSYSSDQFYSNDPLDPTAERPPGDHTWWPDVVRRPSRDGALRIYPVKLLLSMWWGDWIDENENGVPDAGDNIRPLPLWKVRHATNGQTPAGVSGAVNTLAEIARYVNPTDGLLHGDDGTGSMTPIAAHPTLVKGGKVFLWLTTDAGMPADGVYSFDYEEVGIHTESSHPFSINHNVLPTDAHPPLGANIGCTSCHTEPGTGGVFDHLVLVDPFLTDDGDMPPGSAEGEPRYETLRELLGESEDFPSWYP